MSARTPLETFWSDQVLAAARDAAADPSLLPLAITAADGKTRCTWCDCPDGPDSPHNNPAYRCTGCPTTARQVVSFYARPNLRYDYPACEQHYAEIVGQIVRAAAASR
ncbi:hypothetical protein [Streptomyces sp. NRRL F-5123]|uniref:hypothetical protein n=1 Tax=Streptomyces sp. NRRL F-5123 TaxID=1463856 RepID=UPI0004E28969|nr:hypothetical protein [Streptomyces sp. NRRL F-5123]